MSIPATTLLTVVLLLGASSTKAATADDVEATVRKTFATLPGNLAFLFAELNDNGPKPLFGLHENERFAIGSSFKLFILGTLADEVNAGQRQLADVMTLERRWVGPPHSEMAEWPKASPVTLHTLALKMITISDNTATDHLLHLLGRERIEAQMATMGHRHPQWNRPLLSTREMTMLRDKNTGVLGKEYQTLDAVARRRFLAERFAAAPDYAKLDFDTAAYGLAEWYATPLDMARALGWLKRSTERDQPAGPLRAILAVEQKLPHDAEIWPYVGFKGGSEDQLLAGNWLLNNRNGRWYTFHVFCNSPDKNVDPNQILSAIEQILTVIERTIQ